MSSLVEWIVTQVPARATCTPNSPATVDSVVPGTRGWWKRMSWKAWSSMGICSAGMTSCRAAIIGPRTGRPRTPAGRPVPRRTPGWRRWLPPRRRGPAPDPRRRRGIVRESERIEGDRHLSPTLLGGSGRGRKSLVQIGQQPGRERRSQQLGAVAGAGEQPQVLGLVRTPVDPARVLLGEVVVGRVGHDEGEGRGDGGGRARRRRAPPRTPVRHPGLEHPGQHRRPGPRHGVSLHPPGAPACPTPPPTPAS